MDNKQIIKIAKKIVLAKAQAYQFIEEEYDVDSLIVNDVQMTKNNKYKISIYVQATAHADTYEQPYDYYGPPPGTYIDNSSIQIEISDDSYISIYESDSGQDIKFNSNDKIKIEFDDRSFTGNLKDIENDIIQQFSGEMAFDKEWETYDDGDW